MRADFSAEVSCGGMGHVIVDAEHEFPGAVTRLAVDGEEKCAVSGKRKYGSEGEALATAAHQIANAGAPKDLRAYRCSWCDAWHLTKNAAKGGKERR